jgi:hypothetical protein
LAQHQKRIAETRAELTAAFDAAEAAKKESDDAAEAH